MIFLVALSVEEEEWPINLGKAGIGYYKRKVHITKWVPVLEVNISRF